MVIKTLTTRGKNLIPHLYLELVLTDSWQDIVGKDLFLEPQLIKNVLAARDSPCINPLT